MMALQSTPPPRGRLLKNEPMSRHTSWRVGGAADRYFEPATENLPVEFNGERVGITICEDVWNDEDFWRDRRYRRNPTTELVAAPFRRHTQRAPDFARRRRVSSSFA